MDKNGQTRRGAIGTLAGTLAAPYATSGSAWIRDSNVSAPQGVFIGKTISDAIAAGEAAVHDGMIFKAIGSVDGLVEVRKRRSGGSELVYRELTASTLSSPLGGEMVGVKYRSMSAVPEELTDVIFDVLNARSFGAVGDGKTNDTRALKALLAEMMKTGKVGVLGGIGAVTRYLITPGELEWTFTNDGSVSTAGFPGPKLQTLGQVILVSDGTTDAPFLSIHNDPLYDTEKRPTIFIEGGCIGDLVFEDTSVKGTQNCRFGIELYGVNSMRFGTMASTNGLRGDLIRISPQGNSITGDRWHVWNCHFDGVKLFNSPHYAFSNDSLSQFFNYNHIAQIWALGAKGAFRGVGAANRIDGISVGWCTDIGVDLKASPGTTQFCHIGFIECDSPRYGLRVAGIQHARIDGLRVIYRNGNNRAHASLGIPPGVTWPQLAIEFTDLDGRQVVSDFDMAVFHRFNDITQAEMPARIVSYGNVPSHRSISVRHRTVGSFQPTVSLFRQDIDPNTAGIHIELDGALVHDSGNRNLCIVRCIERSGGANYDGSSPVDFQLVQVDQAEAWDAANRQWICPATGIYAFRAKFLIIPLPGDLVRVGLFLNKQVAPIRETQVRIPPASPAPETVHVEVSGHYPFTAADVVKVELYETSGQPLVAGSAGVESNNFFEVVMI